MTKFGTFYFGCHHDNHFIEDFQAIREEGFSWVVVPMSEWDLEYSTSNVHRLVRAADAAGLEVFVNPWGLGGVFGGEGHWRHLMCPFGHEFNVLIDKWTRAVKGFGIAGINWDEPTNKCCEKSFADQLVQLSDTLGLQSMVYLPAERRAQMTLRPGIFGADAYNRKADCLDGAEQACKLGSKSLVWVRGFRIHDEAEATTVQNMLQFVKKFEIDYVGIWGWRGARAMEALECRYEPFWDMVLQEIR